MLTDEQLQSLQANIVALETEIAGLSQHERDLIERARQCNDERRAVSVKRTAANQVLDRARQEAAKEIDARNVEQKRLINERAAAAAAARAAEPQPPSEVELLRKEIAELKGIVQAKSAE